MARNVQRELEAQADRKGLEGERRKQYIGGAWQRITQGEEHRQAWRHSEEYRLLSASLGPIENMRQPKHDPHTVYFRQGGKWYALPKAEYRALVDAAAEEERERKRADEEYEAGRKVYERELAKAERASKHEAVREERKRAAYARAELLRERRERQYAEAQTRALRGFERAQYSDVLRVIQRAGGIRRVRSIATGRERDRGEYDSLPRSVRQKKVLGFATVHDRGLTLDEAATLVADHMPGLRIETPDDLVQFFERHRDVENARRASAGVSLHEQLTEPTPAPARILPAAEVPEPAHEEHHTPTVDDPEPEPAPELAPIPAAPAPVQAGDGGWLDIFGTAQPLPKADTALDLFGGEASTEPPKRTHKHLWEPWRNDWRYMRCKKCGALERSTFAAGVSK